MRTWIPAVLVFAACGDNVGGNRDPIVGEVSLATQEDLPVTRAIDALDNDLGDELTAVVPIPPEHGTATISGLSLTYTPDPNYHGNDQFAVTVSDGTADVSITVDVTVTSVPDQPIGGNDSLATNEDTPRIVPVELLLANDTDADGDTITLSEVGGATNGIVTLADGMVTFAPLADFNGGASFTYMITDGMFTTPVQVDVVVGGANDAPVANDDNASTDEDTPVTIQGTALVANDTDPDVQVLTITDVTNGTGGTVVLDGGNPIFTPAADFNGAATFSYTASDGVASDTATVTVTVNAVNDTPVAGNDSGTTDEDTPITFDNLVGNDTDVDIATNGQTLTVTAVDNATNGSVVLNGGEPIFTPTLDTNQTGTFEYTVSDGAGGTATGTVTITITPQNDPVSAVDDSGTTDEDTSITFSNLTTNDLDPDVSTQGQTLTVTAVTNEVNGTVVLNGGEPIFTPTTNSASDATGSFDYTVDDGNGSTDTGTVIVTITPVNDPPVATADTIDLPTGAQVVIPHGDLLVNDNDGGDGGSLSITDVSNAVSGTVTLEASTITFTPGNGFSGEASFQYTISDGTIATATTTVTLDIAAARVCGDGNIEAPEACDDGNTDAADGCSASCTEEDGFDCTLEPSVCVTTCGDGIVAGTEQCDDGPSGDDDGCTSQCVSARPCNVTEFPGGAAFVIDPATGHCYVGFEQPLDTFATAQAACSDAGGYLATITSSEENTMVDQATGTTAASWIGGFDPTNDLGYRWVTDEPFVFNSFFLPPDHAGGCVTIGDDGFLFSGFWDDIDCSSTLPSVCEFEADSCGDSILQTSQGEECDDSNNLDGDDCDSLCQVEVGCGNGDVGTGEDVCDDDNLVSGDGCSSTCTIEAPFFSEYVEGSGSDNRALEIKNPLSTPFDLTGCTITNFSNGSATPSNTFTFGVASIAANDVFVLCDTGLLVPVAQCDQSSNAAALDFNGDDTVQLSCTIGGIPSVLDTIGDVGFASGQWGSGLNSTEDNTIRRRCTNATTNTVITGGNLVPDDDFEVDLQNEWVGFATDTFDGLGDGTCEAP